VPDGHSGVRQVVDLAVVAAVLAAYRYDAFGNKVAMAEMFTDTVGYRGERFDPVLAQYYLRARFYDPRTGRFSSMDPFLGTYARPGELNRYGYAANNPVMNTDPTGLFTGGFAGFVAATSIGGLIVGGTYGAIRGARQGGVGRAILGAVIGSVVGGVLGGSGGRWNLGAPVPVRKVRS
jgi:RHS repeat-associated protein